MKDELLHMQIRLFRMACMKWEMPIRQCAEIFDSYKLDDYIGGAYEIFHVQGDEANMEELEEYARAQGAAV